jgi:superfamily I DNA and RNA helicase
MRDALLTVKAVPVVAEAIKINQDRTARVEEVIEVIEGRILHQAIIGVKVNDAIDEIESRIASFDKAKAETARALAFDTFVGQAPKGKADWTIYKASVEVIQELAKTAYDRSYYDRFVDLLKWTWTGPESYQATVAVVNDLSLL